MRRLSQRGVLPWITRTIATASILPCPPVLFHWITVGHRLWTVTFLLFAVDELGALVLSARSPACGRKVPGRRVLDYFRCKDIDIAEAGEFCSMACSLALNASFESFGLRVEGVNKRTNDV